VAFECKDSAAAYFAQATTQQQLMRHATDAEARLLLASNMIEPSNDFVFQICITKDL
jgi:hypothetical protein